MFPNYYPDLNSSFLDWERAVIRGHPLHPVWVSLMAMPMPVAIEADQTPADAPNLLCSESPGGDLAGGIATTFGTSNSLPFCSPEGCCDRRVF